MKPDVKDALEKATLSKDIVEEEIKKFDEAKAIEVAEWEKK